DHEIGVAGEAHRHHVERRGRHLRRDLHVDVLESDDVADGLGCPIEGLGHGVPPGTHIRYTIHMPSWEPPDPGYDTRVRASFARQTVMADRTSTRLNSSPETTA